MTRSPLSAVHTHLSAIGGYTLLALILTYPLALGFTTAIPGDGFDGLQNYWNLWWVRRALLELNASPFFTPELYYPNGASLYFHTLNIFNGLASLPVQLLAGLAPAYNTTVLFTFVASGYGAFLLARHTLAGPGRNGAQTNLAAFVGGFIFAFAPFRFAHLLGHMQVLSTEWLPFFVLAFLQMAAGRDPWWRRALLPAFFLALNALCDWYYVLYLLIFCALFVLWRWLGLVRAARKQGSAQHPAMPFLAPVRDSMAVGGLFALMVSPLLVPMLAEAGSASYLRPPFEETISLSADLAAFVLPSEFHPWWGSAITPIADQFTTSLSERTVFAGYVVLALGALGAWRFRRRAAFWLLLLGSFFVLALGPYAHWFGTNILPLPLPYAWLYQLVPLVRITRSVSRFDVMVMLALAVLAALGLSGFNRRWVMLCGALIGVEFLAIPYPSSSIAVPPFYATLRADPDRFALLELPINWDRPDPLLYQTVHQHPLITAYTSRSNPLSMVERTPLLNLLRTLEPDIIVYDVSRIGFSVLSDLDIRYVINHPLTMGAGAERTITNQVLRQLFGARPPLVNDPNLVAYRVPPPAPYVPYLALGVGWGDVANDAGGPHRELVCEPAPAGPALPNSARPGAALPCAATLTIHRRTPDALTLRVVARTTAAGAHLTVSSQSAEGSQTIGAADLVSAHSTFDFSIGTADHLLLTASAPVVVESLELLSP